MRAITRAIVREAGEVRDGGRTRPLVVRLEREGIYFRQKGRGGPGYLLPWECGYRTAVVLAVERDRRAARRGAGE